MVRVVFGTLPSWPTGKSFGQEIFANLKLNLILGLMLSVLLAAGVYFMLGILQCEAIVWSHKQETESCDPVITIGDLYCRQERNRDRFLEQRSGKDVRLPLQRGDGTLSSDITKESPVEFQEMIHAVLGGEELYSYESVRTRKDGSEFDVRVFATPSKQAGGGTRVKYW